MSTFASFLEQTPAPTLSNIAGTANGANIWVRCYYGNWGGVNTPSTPQNIIYTTGFRVSIPINNESDLPTFVVVEASLSQNTGYSVIGILYTQDGSGNFSNAPYILDFDTDEKALILQSINGLPASSNNWINGHRFINTTDSNIYSFENNYPLSANGSSVFDASPSGKWVLRDSNTVFVNDITTLGGSNVKSTTPTFEIPYSYNEGGLDSFPQLLALRNGFDNSGANIIAGTPIGLRVFLNGTPVTNRFQGLVTIKLLYYVNYNDGTLDNTQNSPVIILDTERNDLLKLPKDLKPNEAAIYEVKLKYNGVSLPNIPDNSSITYEIFIYSQSGSPAPWTDFTGNYASELGQQRRVLPTTTVSGDVRSGSVAVEKLLSGLLPDTIITPFISDTSNQRVVIDGNGYPRIVSDTYTLTPYETILAICTTEQGDSTHKLLGSLTLTGSQDLEVSIDYPLNAELNGIIRGDYPDQSIRGFECAFNPDKVRIYIDNGTNYYLVDEFIPTISQSSEIRTISSLGTISSKVTSDLGFFDFELSSSFSAINTGVGTIPDGNYDIYVAFFYDGNRLSGINHQLDVLMFNNNFSQNIVDIREITLTSNLVLSLNDSLYQFLNPGDASRDVFLLENPGVNLRCVIQIIGGSETNSISVYVNPQSPELITTLLDIPSNNYIIDCIYSTSSNTWHTNTYVKSV